MDQSNVWNSSARAWESYPNSKTVSTLFIFSLIHFDFHDEES